MKIHLSEDADNRVYHIDDNELLVEHLLPHADLGGINGDDLLILNRLAKAHGWDVIIDNKTIFEHTTN